MGEEKQFNNNQYSRRFCDERHKEVGRRLNEMDMQIKNMQGWFIGIVLLLIGNLAGVISILFGTLMGG